MNSRVRVIFSSMMVVLIALASAFSVIPARADDGAPPPPAAPSAPKSPGAHSQVPAGTDVVVENGAGHKVSLASQQAADIIATTDPIWCPTGVAPKPGLGGCTPTQSLFNGGLLPLIVNEPKNGTIWILSGLVADASPVTLGGSLGTTVNHALIINGGWNGLSNGKLDPLNPSTFNVPLTINWNAAVTLNDIAITNAGADGLTVTTPGSILLNNINSSTNTGKGAYLDNTAGTKAAGVTLTGTNIFSENGDKGLYVLTNGAITANNLVADANGGRGAWLDNCKAYLDSIFGFCTTATAMPVKLTGSNQFKFNAGGLRIITNGVITLNNINASNNNLNSGVWINNDTSLFGSGITMTGTNTINNNNGGGLFLYSRGAVSVSNLSASGNGDYGAQIWNNTAFTPKPVTLSVSGANPDTNINNNNYIGLEIFSKGAISLNGISASNNNGNGATLENDYVGAVGGVTFSGWGGGFVNNNGDGLNLLTKGAVTATGLYAGSNHFAGAIIDNHAGTGPVTLGTGKSVSFWNNGNDGLDVYSRGAISLNNINADGNLNGAWLQNDYSGAASVTIKNTNTWSPSFNNNWWNGLVIHSRGAVTLMDVDADNNGQVNFTAADAGTAIDHSVGFGIVIDNHAGAGSVTIGTMRPHWCNSMSDNFQSGLVLHSSGTVTLSNMCDDRNGGYFNITGYDPLLDVGNGAYIDNTTGFFKPVTLKGQNDFNGNFDTGLLVNSKGAIKINDLNANDSQGGMGARLDNTFSGPLAPQSVTLTDYGDFYNNYYTGLGIHTYGTITLNDIDSDNNGIAGSNGYGVFLDSCVDLGLGCTAILPRNITINSATNIYNTNTNNFNNNFTGGLEAHSLGAIKISNMNANNNTGFGAFLDNSSGKPFNGITLLVNAYTNDNGGYGLHAVSKGTILVNVKDMWAGNNGDYGWNLDNHLSGAGTGVTLTSIHPSDAFDPSNNGTYGLWVQSRGSILITGLDVGNSGTGFGALLDNAFPGASGSVTITAPPFVTNSFDNNTTIGLEIHSNRLITVGSLEASNNGEAGVLLDNTSSTYFLPQNVTVSGAHNNFNNNGDTGLEVTSYGLITVSNIDSENNGQNNWNAVNNLHILPVNNLGWGAYLDNCGFNWISLGCTSLGIPKGITVNSTTLNNSNQFNWNFQDGLWATSLGPITAHKIKANNNGSDGAYLDNQWPGAASSVTLTSAMVIDWNEFSNNGYSGYGNGWTASDGLEVYSNRTINLNDVLANGNNQNGAFVDTADHIGPFAGQNVNFTGRNSFDSNGDDGLDVTADGNITINNLSSTNNGQNHDLSTGWGAYLDNCLWNGSMCTGHNNITLTGTNTFSYNFQDGLHADSHGNVTMNNVTADGNAAEGIWSLADGKIFVCTGSMTNNGSYGWDLGSLTTVTLKFVTAYGNNGGSGNTHSMGGTFVTSLTCP